jgi:hypothetical protein
VKRGHGAHPGDLPAQRGDEKQCVEAKNGLAAACRGCFLLTASGGEKRNALPFAHRSAFPSHNSHAPAGSTHKRTYFHKASKRKGPFCHIDLKKTPK